VRSKSIETEFVSQINFTAQGRGCGECVPGLQFIPLLQAFAARCFGHRPI